MICFTTVSQQNSILQKATHLFGPAPCRQCSADWLALCRDGCSPSSMAPTERLGGDGRSTFGGFHSHGGYLNSWMVYHGPFINGWFGGTPILGNHHLATQVYAVVPEEMLPSYSCMVLYPYSLLGDPRNYWDFPNGMIMVLDGFGVLDARKWRGQQQK